MGSMDKEEQHRLRSLLVNALTVICRSSLGYRRKFTVEGLLGITLDEQDIILVNVNELVHKDNLEPSLEAKEDFILDNQLSKPNQSVERKSRKRRSPRKTVATWDSPLSPDSASESGDVGSLNDQNSHSINIKGEPGEDGGYGKMPRVIAPSSATSPSCTQTRRDSMPLDLLPDDLEDVEGQSAETPKGRDSYGNKDDAIQCTSTQNSINSSGRLLSTSSEEGSTSQPSNQDPSLTPRTPSLSRPRFPDQSQINAGLMNVAMAANMVAMATRNTWNQAKLPPFQSLLEVKKESAASVGLAIGMHEGRRQVTCKGCGQVFRLQRELVNHAIMTRCRNFTCSHCGKDFVRPEYLYQHIRVKHTEPKYRCPHCGHRSATKQNLLLHMNVHENASGPQRRFSQGSPRGYHSAGSSPRPRGSQPDMDFKFPAVSLFSGESPGGSIQSTSSLQSPTQSLQSPPGSMSVPDLTANLQSPDLKSDTSNICSPQNLAISPRCSVTPNDQSPKTRPALKSPIRLPSPHVLIQSTSNIASSLGILTPSSQIPLGLSSMGTLSSQTQGIMSTGSQPPPPLSAASQALPSLSQLMSQTQSSGLLGSPAAQLLHSSSPMGNHSGLFHGMNLSSADAQALQRIASTVLQTPSFNPQLPTTLPGLNLNLQGQNLNTALNQLNQVGGFETSLLPNFTTRDGDAVESSLQINELATNLAASSTSLSSNNVHANSLMDIETAVSRGSNVLESALDHHPIISSASSIQNPNSSRLFESQSPFPNSQLQ